MRTPAYNATSGGPTSTDGVTTRIHSPSRCPTVSGCRQCSSTGRSQTLICRHAAPLHRTACIRLHHLIVIWLILLLRAFGVLRSVCRLLISIHRSFFVRGTTTYWTIRHQIFLPIALLLILIGFICHGHFSFLCPACERSWDRQYPCLAGSPTSPDRPTMSEADQDCVRPGCPGPCDPAYRRYQSLSGSYHAFRHRYAFRHLPASLFLPSAPPPSRSPMNYPSVRP